MPPTDTTHQATARNAKIRPFQMRFFFCSWVSLTYVICTPSLCQLSAGQATPLATHFTRQHQSVFNFDWRCSEARIVRPGSLDRIVRICQKWRPFGTTVRSLRCPCVGSLGQALDHEKGCTQSKLTMHRHHNPCSTILQHASCLSCSRRRSGSVGSVDQEYAALQNGRLPTYRS